MAKRIFARTEPYKLVLNSNFFIHGGPINQGWLLFRGPWKKPNYNVTKKKMSAKIDKVEN